MYQVKNEVYKTLTAAKRAAKNPTARCGEDIRDPVTKEILARGDCLLLKHGLCPMDLKPETTCWSCVHRQLLKYKDPESYKVLLGIRKVSDLLETD